MSRFSRFTARCSPFDRLATLVETASKLIPDPFVRIEGSSPCASRPDIDNTSLICVAAAGCGSCVAAVRINSTLVLPTLALELEHGTQVG
jgi:hypothetical protein